MKKYICLLLVFALMLSLSTAAFAEEEIENSGQEPAALMEETAPAEDYEPPPGMTDNTEVMENNEENEENDASALTEELAPAEDNNPPPELTENIEENEEIGASAFGEELAPAEDNEPPPELTENIEKNEEIGASALTEELAPAEDNEPPPELTENIEENEEIGAPAFEEDILEDPDTEETVTEPEEPGGEGIVTEPEDTDTEETVTEPEEQDVADHENENAATPSDAEKSPEQSEDDPEMTEDAPLTLMVSPPENGEDDGIGEINVVTVSWVIEDAAIDIASSSSYVWNTETLQYEKRSAGSPALGNSRTVGVSITITNQFGCAVDYSIAYNPDNSVLENSEAPSDESGSSGQIEDRETLTYTGTVTVSGIKNGEALVDEAVITLGTYSVTISSAESS